MVSASLMGSKIDQEGTKPDWSWCKREQAWVASCMASALVIIL